MFAWLCNFRPCRWWHVRYGVWQCSRCKTLSNGRDPDQDKFNAANNKGAIRGAQ